MAADSFGQAQPAAARGLRGPEMLRDLWQHRGLLASLVRREFQVRSVRAAWGNAWLIIQPAIQILIYTVIFAGVLRAKLPGTSDRLAYGLYLCAGVITWSYFADLVTRSQTLFQDRADLLKTIRFPRSVLPLALLVSATIQFAIVAGLFLLLLLVLGRWPGNALLAAVPLLAVQSLLGLGLGVFFGTLNVFYRDVGQAMAVLLQFWFWLTPIVYPVSIVPDVLEPWFAWNPMLHVVSGYQRIVLLGARPEWDALWIVALVALAVAGTAWGVFRKLSPDLVDDL
jgi:lipopolysaccharide transport system permease protein